MKNILKSFSTLFLVTLMALGSMGAAGFQNEDFKSLSQIQSSNATITGNVSSSSTPTCITSPSSITGIFAGLYVYDTTHSTYIPSGTTVVGVPGTCSAGQIQMSQSSIGTATGDTLTFGGQLSQLLNTTKIYDNTNQMQLSASISAGILGGSGAAKNFVANKSGALNTTGWTATGTGSPGSLIRDTTSGNGVDGTTYSLQFTASDATSVVTSSSMTLDNNVTGNCQASMAYKTTASVYSMNLMNGASVLITLPLTANTAYQTASFNYPCGNGYSISLTASGSGAAINYGDVFWGAATNLSSVSQASMYGGVVFPATASCNWFNTASTSFANFSAVSACTLPSGSGIYGNASAPATKIPAIVFSSLPAGEYMIVATGSFGKNTSGGSDTYFRFSDGTNTTSANSVQAGSGYVQGPSIQGRLSYTTAQSNITIQLQGADGDSTAQPAINVAIAPLEIRVYRFPTSSQLAVTPLTSPASWSGTIAGPWSTTGTSLTDFGAAVGTLTPSGNQKNVTCSQYAGNLPGISCVIPNTGLLQVCITNSSSDSVANQSTLFQLFDSNNVAISPNLSVNNPGANAGSSTGGCFDYNATTRNPAWRVLALQGAAGTLTLSSVYFQITDKTQNMPAPYVLNQVTTTAASPVQFDYAMVNGATGAIISQSGLFSGNGTSSNNGWAFTFAKQWATTPVCFMSFEFDYGNAPSSSQLAGRMTALTSSGLTGMLTYNNNGSSSVTYTQSGTWTFFCTGPH